MAPTSTEIGNQPSEGSPRPVGLRHHLVALAGLTLGLLTPVLSVPAYAVGETCNGQAATLVGTPGGVVTGTDGPDVIVTNGAARVEAGAGDDVICTTGTVAADPFNPAVAVLAGAGNDLVDRRGEAEPDGCGLRRPGPREQHLLRRRRP